MKIKCSLFGKEEREKQNGLKAKVYLKGPFCFVCHSRHQVGMSWFWIDSHTINRRESWLKRLSCATLPLGGFIHAHALGLANLKPLKML